MHAATAIFCLQPSSPKVGCSTAGAASSQTLSHPGTELSSTALPLQQPDPISAAATTGNHAAADDEPTPPSKTSAGVTLNLDTSMAGKGSAQTYSNGFQIAAGADVATACTAEITLSTRAAARHHVDCPTWLPEQLAWLQQQYAAAGHTAGLGGDALLGQRVAFALLEDFHQHDSRREVDTLLAGLHTGQ